MKKCILALDEGTSSCRAVVYDENFNMISFAQTEIDFVPNENGWIEQDAEAIWEKQFSVAKQALEKANGYDLCAIGITNQRETTVIWDKISGKPVCNAIVWQCRRTANYCEELKNSGYAEIIKNKTGLIIDPYFSGTKIKWILENVDGAREKAKRGELAFGTIDSWLLYKLTDGKVHATDYTNASRTMLFNIYTNEFDEELLKIFGIPSNMLPEVKPCNHHFADTSLFGKSVPICGIAGDQHASLFGNGCFLSGMAKNTYGTGCFTLINTGENPVASENGLLTTIAYNLNGKNYYALEGSVFNAGSTIKWLRDGLQMIKSSEETEEIARSVENTNDVYLVPAFTGLAAPDWDMYARGVIVGLTQSANRNHIVRAALESIAFQTADVLDSMKKDTKSEIKSLFADGGASRNSFLMQFQSDILNCEISTSMNKELTSLGAAYLASLGCGLKKSTDDFIRSNENSFTPQIDGAEREYKLKKWHSAIERCKSWAKPF